jgi:RNA polymerase sigma-70 factor (ECF subfamily)
MFFAEKREIVSQQSTELATDRAMVDLQVVHACKRGDVAAFEELVRRYDIKLLRIACHITQNREDAEEAVQDAFLKAYMKLDQFEEKSSFSTWLTRIAVNESLGKLRKHRITKERWISLAQPVEGIPLDVADWAPNPEQLYSATEFRAALIKGLESLSPALRVVFVLMDVTGLSGDETAEVLRLALSAVKSRLFRARLQLREKLSKHFRKPTLTKRLTGSEESGVVRFGGSATHESGVTRTTDNQRVNGAFISKVNDGETAWSAMCELVTQR